MRNHTLLRLILAQNGEQWWAMKKVSRTFLKELCSNIIYLVYSVALLAVSSC